MGPGARRRQEYLDPGPHKGEHSTLESPPGQTRQTRLSSVAENVGLDLQDTGALGSSQRPQHNVPQDLGMNQFAEKCKSVGLGDVEAGWKLAGW